MKAACVVAHPDDCIIFARPFIDRYCDWQWHIFYLTYELYQPRVQEMSAYWHQQRKIPVTSLGYYDTHLDIENNNISFNKQQAAKEIQSIVENFDIVLTHNADGDYGHIHHKFVSESLAIIDKPIVYFANYPQANLEIVATSKLDLEQFPLHKEVIENFIELDKGRYYISDKVRELINVQT